MEDPDSLVALLDELPDLICRYLPDGTILYVNRSYGEYIGRNPESLQGTNLLELLPSALRQAVEDDMRSLRRLRPHQPVAVNEHQSTDRHGRIRWLQWTDKVLFDGDGRMREVVSVGRDVTERRDAEEQVRLLAYRDPLTGLLNRRSLVAELEGALRQALRTGTNVGLVFVDVDGFKSINDRHGHTIGDQVLIDIARQLERCFQAEDVIARMGGDEFVVVCPGIGSPAELEGLASRVRRLVADVTTGGVEWSVSVGSAFGHGDVDVDTLLSEADRQMYRHKSRRCPGS